MRVFEVLLVIVTAIALSTSTATALSMPFGTQTSGHHMAMPSLKGAGSTASPFGSRLGMSLGSMLQGFKSPGIGTSFKQLSAPHLGNGAMMGGFGRSMGQMFNNPFNSMSSHGLSSLLKGFPTLK